MGVNFSRSREVDAHCPPDVGSSDLRENCDVMEQDTREKNESEEEFFETQDVEPRSHTLEMIEFKKELAIKREQRRKILAKHASDKENLKKSLEIQVKANEVVKNENKLLRDLLERHGIEVPERTASEGTTGLQGPISLLMSDLESLKEHNRKMQRDLAETNLALQSANADMVDLHDQNVQSMKQISALKEVVAVSKTMMKIRESQLIELKEKLGQIESSLAEREASLLSTDLRAEYERQLLNIRTLRALYEERARLADVTRLQLTRELEEQKLLAEVETSRCRELTEKVAELEAKIAVMSDTIDNKDDQLSSTEEESRGLRAEMSTVNKLFSQMLLGYKSQQDLDKLVSRLEEHHGLLAHMVTRDGSEASSALPKLLLDLVSQVDEEKEEEGPKKDESSLSTTAEEIVGNLPKVWRVLMELLSHQAAPEPDNELHPTTCYKPVDTPSGTRMVPSVSQTYIRLKDLIVEKLSLTKEMTKMKQLNAHLESRLEEQERRLCLVTSELGKTWHVVGRLRRHHHQLHTHEKILRYELQQKRKMLNELKEELEYCKEKWDKAREKNTESEKDWRNLRNEFSSRKSKVNSPLNNSGESGYSDERQTEDESTESNDESEYVNDPPIRCKKRIKKTSDILPDSSTEVNPAAEREDPISDLLDVADLPLDGLDAEEREDDLSTSESCISESFPKSPCPPGNDEPTNSKQASSANEGTTKIEFGPEGPIIKTVDGSTTSQTNYVPVNTPQQIFENIRKQNERLVKRDQRLNSLEESSASLLKQVTKTKELRQGIEERLQRHRNKTEQGAGSSNDLVNVNIPDKSCKILTECITQIDTDEGNSQNIELIPVVDLTTSSVNNIQDEESSSSKTYLNPKEILENIKRQNERLAQRDERMKMLEEGCSSLLQTSRSTLQVGTDLEARLDNIKSERSCIENIDNSKDSGRNEISTNNELSADSNRDEEIGTGMQNCAELSHNTDEPVCIENADTEPSTSSGSIDHEARFAARDVRLKRLEEQTKSLVNKVNDTNTKSMKITYKLEELHNIYGSEGSTPRNQSPSDDESEADDTE